MAGRVAVLQPVRSAASVEAPTRHPPGAEKPGTRGADETREDVLDEKIRQMLRDLGRALSEAMSESADVDQALRRIHEEGYSLFIFLDRHAGEDDEEVTTKVERGGSARPHGEPVFRIHGGDLSFLRSIGIDPTRRVRLRKSR